MTEQNRAGMALAQLVASNKEIDGAGRILARLIVESTTKPTPTVMQQLRIFAEVVEKRVG